MEKATPMYLVVVQNRIRNGYRRAGFALAEGENHLENVPENALVQLKADPRLVVSSVEAMSAQSNPKSPKGLPEDNSGRKGGQKVDLGALPADLNTLTVEQLKNKLTELNVEFAKNANKATLIELLKNSQKLPSEPSDETEDNSKLSDETQNETPNEPPSEPQGE